MPRSSAETLPRPRRNLLALFAIAAVAGLGTGCGDSEPEQQRIGYLFTQTASSGSFEPRGDGGFTLELRGVSPQVVLFSDRPQRRSGQMATRDFVRDWAGLGFAEDRPNGALTLLDVATGKDTVVLELGRPDYSAEQGVIRYPARLLGEASGNLVDFERRRDASVPRRFGAASLFIDDATGQTINGCLIAPNTICSGADLTHADLSGSSLSGAQLHDADLTDAKLIDANLSGANLSGATLESVDATGVNLSGAELSGARIGRSSLLNANASDANLGAALFCDTVMPNGTIESSGCGDFP